MPVDPPAGAQAGPDDANLPQPAQPEPVAHASEPAPPAEPTPPQADPIAPPPQAPVAPPPADRIAPPPQAPVAPPPAHPIAPPPADPIPQASEPAPPQADLVAQAFEPAPPQPGEPAQPTELHAWPPASTPPAPLVRPRRRNRMVFVTSGLLLALLALVAVPLVVNAGEDGSTPGGGDTSSAPAVKPASPEQYQVALTSMDSALTTGWRKLSTARTPATVGNAADALALTVQSEAEKLRAMTPPERVAAAHSLLVSSLEAFSMHLSSGPAEDACSGSSAVPQLSRDNTITQVRTAAQALGAADPAHPYRVGTWVPKVAKEPNRRLSNGKYIKRSMSNGSGHLKIKNGGPADGVVSIVAGNGKRPAIVVYVRGKQNFTVRGVRDGTYHIFLTTGTDWDSAARTFSRDCAFERFEDTFKFRTTSTTYTIWEITVQAATGGNATATSVSPDDFPVG